MSRVRAEADEIGKPFFFSQSGQWGVPFGWPSLPLSQL